MAVEDQVINKEHVVGSDKFLQITTHTKPLPMLEQARLAKVDLERAINALVWNFEQRTGCAVVSVDPKPSPTVGARTRMYWVPKVAIGGVSVSRG